MASRWIKVLLGVVLSVVVFGAVAAVVYDAHPLGGSSDAYARQQACIDENRYRVDSSVDCYEIYRRQQEQVDLQERLIAAGAGAAAVGLAWLLAHFFYFRPRRRRREQEADAV